MKTSAPPTMIIAGIVAALALVGGIAWFFLRPATPTYNSQPPAFIDPATGKPKWLQEGGAPPSSSSPTGAPPSGMTGGAPPPGMTGGAPH